MIGLETRYGEIRIENEFFAQFIGNALSSCYGVSGLVATNRQKVKNLLARKTLPETGIIVSGSIDKIAVDLYITVMYGVNINAISRSIVHKVKYTVEEATGIQVDRVTVHVDGMSIDD